MDREAAILALQAIQAEQDDLDWEKSHVNADRVLLDLLTSLGYPDVVAEWEKVEKWYA